MEGKRKMSNSSESPHLGRGLPIWNHHFFARMFKKKSLWRNPGKQYNKRKVSQEYNVAMTLVNNILRLLFPTILFC